MGDYDDDNFHGDDELEDLTEKIQYGDRSEGAEALQKVIERARGGVNAGQAVRRELAVMRMEAEHQAALERFAKKYPKLKDDQILAEAGRSVLRNQIVEDLRGIGIEDDKLASVRDVGQLAAAHGAARLSGMKVRSPQQILDATGAELSRKFNIHPARRSPNEVIRHMRETRGFRTDDEHFPASRPEPSAADAAQRERTRRAIAEARQARHFDTYE